MRFEILTEDRSGAVVIGRLVDKIASEHIHEYSISVRPHRGRGEFPSNPMVSPVPFASGLLDLLPAKLRAYDKVYAGTDIILIVIMDADNHPPAELSKRIRSLCSRFAPGIWNVVGLCVEETESWMIADKKALLTAYPDANMDILRQYEQDSACGTWEVLCHALLRNRAEQLIRIGYPAIGQYKYEWADKISEFMVPDQNTSPSFQRFYSFLSQTITRKDKWLKES
jgi:hypothetical protein